MKPKGRSRKPQPAASLFDWALSLEQEREKELVPALTAISSSAGSLMGLTCLNHSTSTRSDSFNPISHRFGVLHLPAALALLCAAITRHLRTRSVGYTGASSAAQT